MILCITDKCSMGCTHCLSDCKPDGKHITMEQFEKNLEWCLPLLDCQPIMISGGEPFEHPEIKEILTKTSKRIIQYKKQKRLLNAFVAVITNGTFVRTREMFDWYRDFTNNSANRAIFKTQVTRVPKYYPVELSYRDRYYLQKLKDTFIEENESSIFLYPQGRALDIADAQYQTKAPKCVNSRMNAKKDYIRKKSAYDLFREISNVSMKFCVPRVNIDGSISLGESRLCPPVGTIEDSPYDLFTKIAKFKCYKCTYSIDVLEKTNPLLYQLFKLEVK